MTGRYITAGIDGTVSLGSFRDVRADWDRSVWAIDSHDLMESVPEQSGPTTGGPR
jgi:hypothetical protein